MSVVFGDEYENAIIEVSRFLGSLTVIDSIGFHFILTEYPLIDHSKDC